MTMRERMAKAMYELCRSRIPNCERIPTWERQTAQRREDYLADADICLEVLMEPTDAMKTEAALFADAVVPQDELYFAYKHMIRAAKEGK